MLGPILLCAASGLSAAAIPPTAPQTLLVGTYTASGSGGIQVFDFDAGSGKLGASPRQVVASENPSWLVVAEDGRTVYAVNENGPGQRDPIGRASAFKVDLATRTFQQTSQITSLGNEPTHASISQDGRFLFVANYSGSADPGGTLVVLPVEGEQLKPAVQVKTHHASRVNPERQQAAHVHSAVTSPDGKRVYAQDLGADRIYVYRYDPSQPEAPLSRDKQQPEVVLPPGSGPRHLVFSADGRHAWLTLEMPGQVAAFEVRDGQLIETQRLDLAPKGFSGDNAAAALHLSSDGRFLYVSNRGTDNHLVVFAVDAKTGQLTQVQRRSVEGNHPREFTLSPDGRYLLVANQLSNAIVVMQRDAKSGKVGEVVQTVPVKSPSDLKFLPAR